MSKSYEGNHAGDGRDQHPSQVMRVKSRRSFLTLGLGAIAGVAGWEWLTRQPEVDGRPYLLRRALEFNGGLAARYFRASRLAPTFPRTMAREPRVNGAEGLTSDFDPLAWRLRVLGTGDPLQLTLEDVKRLPRVEMTTELMCIEGWSVVVNWAGSRLSDFAAANKVITRDAGTMGALTGQQNLPGYVGLTTPDGGYYVGLDMQSALHPQTLLCYEMNGRPLSIEHGAPLRLVTPVR